jgi:hypothetical protein
LSTQTFYSQYPVVTAAVASVSLTLWGALHSHAPRGEITLTGADGARASVTVTPIEGALLASAIQGTFEEEDEEQE